MLSSGAGDVRTVKGQADRGPGNGGVRRASARQPARAGRLRQPRFIRRKDGILPGDSAGGAVEPLEIDLALERTQPRLSTSSRYATRRLPCGTACCARLDSHDGRRHQERPAASVLGSRAGGTSRCRRSAMRRPCSSPRRGDARKSGISWNKARASASYRPSAPCTWRWGCPHSPLPLRYTAMWERGSRMGFWALCGPKPHKTGLS